MDSQNKISKIDIFLSSCLCILAVVIFILICQLMNEIFLSRILSFTVIILSILFSIYLTTSIKTK